MAESELFLKHRVGLSFLKYGFTITGKEINTNKSFLQNAVDNKTQIKVLFEGKQYDAYFDLPSSSMRFRFMFRSNLTEAFQKKFKECYTIDDNGEINAKDNVVTNVGFYKTSEVDTFIAKQIGKTIIVNVDDVRNEYQDYLINQGGKFPGYVKAIDKQFVKEITKKLFDLPSAYYITEPKDIYALVDEIRNNPDSNEKDKASNNRCPSCSLKKFAEFLKYSGKSNSNQPFSINIISETIKQSGLIFDPKFIQRYICSLLTKPFVILSGLTGSGKTQLALAFTKIICNNSSQYKLIPVGADWTNREQLLGYPNALRKGEYVLPDNGALQLIIEASKQENQDKPYFLILDEMNMSYVERYFADFLSAMESGESIPLWEGNNEVPASITLPKNLFIIGTINVDETTYLFSPKVLDRANVIEFRINKEQMEEYLETSGSISKFEDCSDYAADFVFKANKTYSDSLSKEMKKTLIDMFVTLEKIQKEFGYRTAHEMSRFISITKSISNMTDNECLDSAIVQKLLPKIHGSRKKVTPVLKALWDICYNNNTVDIDTLELFPEISTFKYPLTAEKIWRMFQIAQDNGFTSFAEA